MTDHPSRDRATRPHLLDELEAIKTLLRTDTSGDIGATAPDPAPPPHAPVPTLAESAPLSLLDLDFIFNEGDNATVSLDFGEEIAPLFPRFTLAIPDQPQQDELDNAHRERCPRVESLLRHLLPHIETALREHLHALDPHVLADWQTRLK